MATVGVSTSNNVYVLSKEHGWVPARVIEYQDENNSKCVVQIPQYKEENDIQSDGGKHARGTKQEVISLKVYPNKTLPLQNVDDNGVLNQVEDMVDLPFLHEVSPGYNKCVPFSKSKSSHSSLLLCVTGSHSIQPQGTPCAMQTLHKDRRHCHCCQSVSMDDAALFRTEPYTLRTNPHF